MSKKIRVLVIVASVRPRRRADAVLAWWRAATGPCAEALGVDVEIADLREVHLPFDDEPEEPDTGRYIHEHTRRWSRTVAGADAFVVVTSEHNHSMPASLKNAFDHLAAEWAGKPIAWLSYGNTSAGTRALLSAKQVATTLGLSSVPGDISLHLADWTGDTPPADAARSRRAVRQLERLVAYAQALRPLRGPRIDVGGLAAGLVAHRAQTGDAAELLVLQRCCWVDEAIVNNTLAIAALHEDLDEVSSAIATRRVVVVRRGARLIASVQCWQDGADWRIGRLMVAPDERRRGLARVLLRYAQEQRPPGTRRITLATGAHSRANIALYESEGFEQVRAPADDVIELAKRSDLCNAS
ncbi:GNAT family N-acetyltransferase [Microbacterium sp. ASV49]|uniref:GNAT family N-acetyltransferase n=1 Tax=Microbacterium candidum TaxID=3041922 RepID=A0ABT7MXN8_9MICO|nr:GNAT family N-acetyltransferase [Microbacterium sp. ASV49]MDL9979219.1 GNAT family N-acetyltransferase [Microbacterium sp. ASV49]